MPASMTHPPITPRTFELLRGLARHNEREWFLAHKAEYEVECRDAFAGVLEACTEALAGTSLPLKGGKATMFRPYRDVRFSKDKRPYKTSVSGMLTPTGTKGEPSNMVYLHLEPMEDGSAGFIASGHYKMSPKQLAPVRQRMVEEPARWHAALDALNARGLTLSMEDSLSSMPRGFSEHADHELADYIKLKSLITQEPVSEADWMDGTVVARVVNMAEAVGSLLNFRV